MSRKGTDNALALPPLRTGSGATHETNLAPWTSSTSLTRRERSVISKSREHRLRMAAKAAKVRYAHRMIADIHEHMISTFDETESFITEVKERPGRSDPEQSHMDQFSERGSQMLARELMGATEIGATGIALLLHQDCEPEERSGPVRRLLGD